MMRTFTAKYFDELTTHDLYEIFRARTNVFTGEEKILYPDADGVDYNCIHVYHMDENGLVQAYLRMFMKQDEPGTVQMGRVLTVERGTGLGKELVMFAAKAAVKMLQADEIYIESQKHAIGFYEKLGFRITSDEFMEAGIPHVQMRLSLA